MQVLDAKMEWLTEQMEHMIEIGRAALRVDAAAKTWEPFMCKCAQESRKCRHLTKGEVRERLDDWGEKREKLTEAIEKAQAAGKKTTKLEEQLALLDAKAPARSRCSRGMRAQVKAVSALPAWTPAKKNAKEIAIVKRKLAELEKIEKVA